MKVTLANNNPKVHQVQSLENRFTINSLMYAKVRPELIVNPRSAFLALMFAFSGNSRVRTVTSWITRPINTRIEIIIFSVGLGFVMEKLLRARRGNPSNTTTTKLALPPWSR